MYRFHQTHILKAIKLGFKSIKDFNHNSFIYLLIRSVKKPFKLHGGNAIDSFDFSLSQILIRICRRWNIIGSIVVFHNSIAFLIKITQNNVTIRLEKIANMYRVRNGVLARLTLPSHCWLKIQYQSIHQRHFWN